MQRNISLDYFKILLSAMVVAIHTEVINNSYFLIDGLFRIAVPIFFIINGYFSFYKINSSEDIVKWSKRILIMYVFWMVFYAPLYIFKIDGVGNQYFINLLSTLFFGYRHLWYIPAMLFGGGIVYLLRGIQGKWLLVIFISLFIIGYSLEWERIFSSQVESFEKFDFFNQYWIYRNGLFVGVPFFGLGYLIAKYKIDKMMSNFFLLSFLLVICVLGLFLEAGFIRTNISDDYFFHVDILFFLIIISPVSFLIVLQFKHLGNDHNKIISLLASGIYFIHPLFVSVLKKLISNNNLIFIISFILSLVTAFLVIKYIKTSRFVF